MYSARVWLNHGVYALSISGVARPCIFLHHRSGANNSHTIRRRHVFSVISLPCTADTLSRSLIICHTDTAAMMPYSTTCRAKRSTRSPAWGARSCSRCTWSSVRTCATGCSRSSCRDRVNFSNSQRTPPSRISAADRTAGTVSVPPEGSRACTAPPRSEAPDPALRSTR